MLNKIKKLRGFTLIELIIVIAIIAILAAIAVPAFGQIRQKANESADLANARTMFSVISTEIASENITLPQFNGTSETVAYYDITAVGVPSGEAVDGKLPGTFDVTTQMTETKVKQYPNAHFIVSLDSNGDIAIGYTTGADAKAANQGNYTFIYGDDTHAKTLAAAPQNN